MFGVLDDVVSFVICTEMMSGKLLKHLVLMPLIIICKMHMFYCLLCLVCCKLFVQVVCVVV